MSSEPLSAALQWAQIFASDDNNRGQISRALLSHNAALRLIFDKCCEPKVPDADILGYVMEVAGNALREMGE